MRRQIGQLELGRFAQDAGFQLGDGSPDVAAYLDAVQDMAQGLADMAKAATTPPANPQIDAWGAVAHLRNYTVALRDLLRAGW